MPKLEHKRQLRDHNWKQKNNFFHPRDLTFGLLDSKTSVLPMSHADSILFYSFTSAAQVSVLDFVLLSLHFQAITQNKWEVKH